MTESTFSFLSLSQDLLMHELFTRLTIQDSYRICATTKTLQRFSRDRTLWIQSIGGRSHDKIQELVMEALNEECYGGPALLSMFNKHAKETSIIVDQKTWLKVYYRLLERKSNRLATLVLSKADLRTKGFLFFLPFDHVVQKVKIITDGVNMLIDFKSMPILQRNAIIKDIYRSYSDLIHNGIDRDYIGYSFLRDYTNRVVALFKQSFLCLVEKIPQNHYYSLIDTINSILTFCVLTLNRESATKLLDQLTDDELDSRRGYFLTNSNEEVWSHVVSKRIEERFLAHFRSSSLWLNIYSVSNTSYNARLLLENSYYAISPEIFLDKLTRFPEGLHIEIIVDVLIKATEDGYTRWTIDLQRLLATKMIMNNSSSQMKL